MVHTMERQTDEIAGVGRRHHDRQFKRRLVELSQAPGASVAAIALEHGINANLLFKWRRSALHAQAKSEPAVLLPVHLKPELLPAQAASTQSPPAGAHHPATSGSIELEVASALVRLQGDVNEANLRSVLRALRQRP
jgi:transposase